MKQSALAAPAARGPRRGNGEAAPDSGEAQVHGENGRSRWPLAAAAAAFLIMGVFGATVIWLAEEARVADRRQSAAVTAAAQASRIREQLDHSMSASHSLAALIKQGNGRIPDFERVAREMLPLFPGVSALQLAPKGVIRQIVPLAGNEPAIGHDLFADDARNKEAAIAVQTRRLTLAGPFTLRQGGDAVIGRMPVFLDDAAGEPGTFWGFTIVVVNLDNLVAASAIDNLSRAGYRYELSRANPDTGARQVFYRSSGQPLRDPLGVNIDVPNGRWLLSVEPRLGWQWTETPAVDLMLALFAALGAALAAHQAAQVPAQLGRLVRRRTQEIESARAKLEHSEARFRDLAEATSDWIWEVDANLIYTYASPKVRDLLGYEPSEVIGRSPFDLMPPDEAVRVRALFQTIAQGPSAFALLENVNLHKDGRLVVLETNGIPLLDAQGRLRGYRGIDRDISDRKRLESELEQFAYYDRLTGLPNRALFVDRIGQAAVVALREERSFALLMLDVDRLKNINDSLGHDAGDQLLKAVAQRLRNAVREEDSVARLEGDEFAALIMGTAGAGDTARVAEKMREALRAPFRVNDQDLHVTASIGISLLPGDASDIATLERNADTALHRAKKTGDCFRFFKPNMNDEVSRFLVIENKLRVALSNSQFVLHYQPQFDLKRGRVGSVEALIRWRDPDLGLVLPDQFIPLAEETGLILPISDWVLHEACRQAVTWRDAGFPCRIAVNLSPLQFRNERILDSLRDALSATGATPDLLELEITESVLMKSDGEELDALRKLAAAGFRIAVDDFGSGYSSLAYLKHMPAHVLKIDGSFVRDLAANHDDRAIVSSVITLGHALGMDVLAEFAETRQQLALLRGMGCDAIQGYLYCPPLPAEEMLLTLRESRLFATG